MSKANAPSLQKNAVMSGLNMGLSLIFPLITLPYVSRVLGVENIGKYNFSNNFVSYFILIATLGVNTYGIRECAKVREDSDKASAFVSQIFSINMVTTFASYLLLFAILFGFESFASYRGCVLIFSSTLLFTGLGVEWVYKAYEQFTYITVRNAVFKLAALGLLFILVHDEGDYLKYAAVTVFATCGSSLLNFIHSRKFCRIRITRHIDWSVHMRPLIILSASAIAVHIYNSSDTLMLGLITNEYYVGLYAISSKIYLMAKSILLALLSVAIPRLSIMISDRKRFGVLVGKIADVMNFFALPLVIGIFLISDEIVCILAGQDYLGASPSLKILSIAIICSMYAWISSECVLIPAGREKESFISTGIAACINIGLNFVLIPLWNVNAAAVTTVIAEGFVMVFCTLKTKGIVNVKFFHKETGKALMGCIGIGVVCVLSKYYISNLFIRTGVAVIGSGFAYAVICFSLKNKMALMIKNKALVMFRR